MERHLVSEIGQKGITRLVSRFQRDFSSDQTPDSLISQAEKVRDLTISLMTVAAKNPDRLGVFLSIISGMGDIGVIGDMDSAVKETVRLMNLLPSDGVSSVTHAAVPALLSAETEKAEPEMRQIIEASHKMDPHLFDDADKFVTPAIVEAADRLSAKDSARSAKVAARSVSEDRKRYGETFVEGMSTTLPEKPGQWISPKDKPRADIGLSVSEDSITCLHCGETFTMIKRHIERQHRQTPDDYRRYWGLPPEYPMAATNYTLLKREEAKGTGLGTYSRQKKNRKKVSAH